MLKVAVVVLADTETHEGLGRVVNAMDAVKEFRVQVGPRPYYIIDEMESSKLKRKLERCSEISFYGTGFSIGHRGGTIERPGRLIEGSTTHFGR